MIRRRSSPLSAPPHTFHTGCARCGECAPRHLGHSPTPVPVVPCHIRVGARLPSCGAAVDAPPPPAHGSFERRGARALAGCEGRCVFGLPLRVLRADADVLRARYVLVQMQEGVGAASDKRGLHPRRAGGPAAIAAVTALRLLVGVGRSRSCLPQRGRAGGCSSPLALRARCLWTPSPAHD